MTQFLSPGAPAVRERLDLWQANFDRGEYDLVLKSVLEFVPVRAAHALEPQRFKGLAAYYLASAFAVRGEFERAGHYAELIDLDAPPHGAELLPYDLRQGGRLARIRQELAIANRRPYALVVSLMRSASATLTETIAASFEIPVIKTCVGDELQSVVVTHWAAQLARGGAVTHEHFRALPVNLAALRDAGIRSVWVQVRDPRDAAFSLARVRHGQPSISPHYTLRPNSDPFVADCQQMAHWIGEWIAARAGSGPDIQFTTFADVTGNLAGTVARMFPGRTPRTLVTQNRNVRRGSGGEWRTLDASLRQRAFDAIPADVKDLLGLEA